MLYPDGQDRLPGAGGALSQLQEALHLIEARHGSRPDLSRIDFADRAVYRMLGEADTIGVFHVESAAQMQTITRLRPESLVDLAHEVVAVRPGVGVNDGVARYLRRRQGREAVTYDHPLEQRSLERTLGVILFQDQVNQVTMDVAGFSPAEADRLRGEHRTLEVSPGDHVMAAIRGRQGLGLEEHDGTEHGASVPSPGSRLARAPARPEPRCRLYGLE